MNKRNELNLRVFLVAFLIIFIINLYLFKGLFHSLAFAAITSGTFFPLNERIKKKFKITPEISASMTTALIVCIIVIPCILIIFQISKEAVGLYGALKQGLTMTQVRDTFFGEGFVAKKVIEFTSLIGIDINLNDVYQQLLLKIQNYSGKVLQLLNSWVSDTLSFLFNFLVMILAIFTFFVEGHRLKRFIFDLSPLPDSQENLMLEKFSQMNFVTLVCNGIGGLIQGILAGLAMWACGFHSIFLWSTVMVILAFIPLVGISFVTIPASIYLLVIGHVKTGITFFLITASVSLIVENWFKPKFMGKRIKVNSLLVLFYIIAGMGTFGMAGIFYGPLLCIIFLTMVELFQDYYLPKMGPNEYE